MEIPKIQKKNDEIDWVEFYVMMFLLLDELDKMKTDMNQVIAMSLDTNSKQTKDYITKVTESRLSLDIVDKITYNDIVENNDFLKPSFDKMKGDLETSLKNNLYQDKDLDYIVKQAVQSIYDENGKISNGAVYKAMRIIRTENTKFRTKAKYNAMNELKSMGYNVRRRWVYTWESRVPRRHHVSMNNVLDDEFGYFHVDGNATIGPAHFGIPSEDINCMCDTEIVFIDHDQNYEVGK